MIAKVYVTLKTGVLDPQGETVRRALGTLGFSSVDDVRVGKYIEIRLGDGDAAAAREKLETMCKQLLANPVIEDYRVEVSGD